MTGVKPRKGPSQLPKDSEAQWTEEIIDMYEGKRGICRAVVCVNLLAEYLEEEHQSTGKVTVRGHETW